jgi:hypothetical protein
MLGTFAFNSLLFPTTRAESIFSARTLFLLVQTNEGKGVCGTNGYGDAEYALRKPREFERGLFKDYFGKELGERSKLLSSNSPCKAGVILISG